MHFERCAIVNGWNEKEKAMFLSASLFGENRTLLSGLSALAWRNRLSYTRLSRQLEGESLQMLATDFRSVVDLTYQDVGVPLQESFAVQDFIDALTDRS